MIISSISSLLHSRFFASIRGSKSLNESALRGRIALPVKETGFQEVRIQRRMGCFDPQSTIYDHLFYIFSSSFAFLRVHSRFKKS
jgi:hypothetical protein